MAGNPSVTCGDSSAQGTPFGCPKGEPRNANLQTPYQIKLTACTRKHLNINITDTGKGNNRRWQAPGGQRVQRANSAGRFRHGKATLHEGTPPPASLVPLVLSGPLCPAGISPPRGESPLSGEAISCKAGERVRYRTPLPAFLFPLWAGLWLQFSAGHSGQSHRFCKVAVKY